MPGPAQIFLDAVVPVFTATGIRNCSWLYSLWLTALSWRAISASALRLQRGPTHFGNAYRRTADDDVGTSAGPSGIVIGFRRYSAAAKAEEKLFTAAPLAAVPLWVSK